MVMRQVLKLHVGQEPSGSKLYFYDGLLVCFRKLKKLVLYDLPGVRYKEKCLQTLQNALPDCEIDFKDIAKAEKKKT